jgi:hypothetical protein
VVTIALSGHRRGLRLAVHAAALAAWALAGIAVAAAPLVLVGIWALAGAAIAWNAVRQGAGRETLTLTPRFLFIGRRIGPFQFTRRYDLESLTHVHAMREPGLGHDRHRIEFVCRGRARRFGRNLTAREASTIVDLIRRSAAPAP